MTPPPVSAAIDIGSNSVHLLVAKPGRRMVPLVLVDVSLQTGVGAVVDAQGDMGTDARATLAAAVGGYVDQARDLGAQPVLLLGTEPLRQASDTTALAQELVARTGLAITVLDREQEGLLTLLGVTGGVVREPVVVVDIGGGSTEVIFASPGRSPVVGILPAGSARLTAAIVRHDPVTPDEIEQLLRVAREHVATLPPWRQGRMFVSGGSGTNVSRLLGRDRTAPVERAAVDEAFALLRAHPAEELAARTGLTPRRCSQLAAGLAIGRALAEHLGVEVVEVSDASLREGALIAAWALGPDWLAGLPAHVAGLGGR